MALQEQARTSGAGVFGAAQSQDTVAIDPAARAAIDRARKIRCYAGLDSFDVRPLYSASGEPTPADMWDAQMSYWVQRDIVEVIAAINEEAAARVPTANVLNMPVKRIVGIRIGEYVTKAAGAAPARAARDRSSSGEDVPAPPDDPDSVFTARKPGSLYDVVYFRVRVILDSRDVQDFIRRLSEKNLYTAVEVAMNEVERSENYHDYLYGPDPVVDLDVAFEALFLRSAYKDLMPDEVIDRIEGRAGASDRRREAPAGGPDQERR
jgi:hypothetical protein